MINDEEFYATEYEEFYATEYEEELEVANFNKKYGVNYTKEQLFKLQIYMNHYELEPEVAMLYIKTCHSCNDPMETFADEYCRGGCHTRVEELGFPCFRGTSCLICFKKSDASDVTGDLVAVTGDLVAGNLVADDLVADDLVAGLVAGLDTGLSMPDLKSSCKKPVLEDISITTDYLKEIDDFYKTYYDGLDRDNECIEGENDYASGKTTDELRIQNWRMLKAYSASNKISCYEARYYFNHCHCCGQYMNRSGYLYCSIECKNIIETDNYCCYNNVINKKYISLPKDCLICLNAGRARSKTISPFVERVNQFYYLTGYDGFSIYDKYKYGVKTFKKAEAHAAKHNISLLNAFLAHIGKVCEHPKSYAHYNSYKCTYANCVARKFRSSADKTIDKLSTSDLNDLTQYAYDYGVELERAFQEQHVCRTCKNDVVPQTFGPKHQFCSAKCEVIYDLTPFNDSCSTCEGRNKNCRMCDGEVYYLCMEIAKKEKELKTPVLSTIHALQDLLVCNQLDNNLIDLVEFMG
jgi:hypothetical protein